MRAGPLPRFRPVSFHAPPLTVVSGKEAYMTAADLILYNGDIHTMDRQKPLARAAAVKATAFWP